MTNKERYRQAQPTTVGSLHLRGAEQAHLISQIQHPDTEAVFTAVAPRKPEEWR